MDNNRKISCIVPVYKTEPYLKKCVDSLLNQTWQDLEIILIDDGSPDRCPEICEEYAKKDSRVRVIHQKNAGLSAARNRGIQESVGQWIGFVDSDDEVHPDFYRNMMDCAQKHHAQMVICGVEEVSPQGNIICTWCPDFSVMNREQTQKYFLTVGKGREYACNKLYRKELFRQICFPLGRLYEDTFILHHLVEEITVSVTCPLAGYRYLRREGAISSDLDLCRQLDGLYAKQDKAQFLQEHYPKLFPLAQAEVMESCCWLFYKWYLAGADRNHPCFAVLTDTFRDLSKEKFPLGFLLWGAKLLIRIRPELFGRCYHWYKKRF